MNCNEKIYCGVDVSKHHLDAMIREKIVRFDNTTRGAEALMNKVGDVHYVFESTGGYERVAAWTLMKAGATVSIVNPSRVRLFAQSMGELAKTDPIDARMITLFSETAKPRISELPPEQQRQLSVLVDRRQQLRDYRTAEGNRLETAAEPILKDSIQQLIDWLAKQLEDIENQIDEIIHGDQILEKKAARIQLIKGLGKITAMTLLAHLPEIGTLSRREIAALVGLAPYNRDSGKTSKQRHICGGRKRLRACLYMAAVCAVQHNPTMKEFYTRLVEENHRPKKVALTAVMRKLVIAANSAVKNPDFLVVV